MARSAVKMDDIFANTTQGTQPPAAAGDALESGTVRPIGVGLTGGEIAALDSLAKQWATNRHTLLKLAVRLFLRSVLSGSLDLGPYFSAPVQPKRRVILP